MTQKIIRSTFVVEAPSGGVLRGDVRCGESDGDRLAVVLCHGFKGFKDWGCFPYLMERLAESGFYAVSFNFSHNGVGEDLQNFTELDRFRQNTLSKEAADLHEILELLRNQALPFSERWNGKVALMGHSRGGYSVIANGKEEGVFALVLLASIAHLPVPTLEGQEEWRRQGVQYVLNSRTGQRLPLGVELLEDMLKNQHQMESVASEISIPAVIIHGERDDAVPFQHALELHGWIKNSRVVLLPEGDHVFGARHPFSGTTPELERVIDETVRFLTSESSLQRTHYEPGT